MTRQSPEPSPWDAARLYYPPELPITERREEIVQAIRDHRVLVLTGETGSGKSTQIPKMCLEAGQGSRGLVGCTQPRRVAAVTLAARVAEELRSEGPATVGYKIRFQDRTARTTRIKFMTDGILLAEAQRDRLFRAYDTIIVDEAHERTLNIDFLIGLLRKVLLVRNDLKVIVTSATIDPEKFSAAFDNAPIIEVSGRTYPVDVRYQPPEDEEGEDSGYIDGAVAAVDSLKSVRERGDILVFMPTESDIRETSQRLEEKRYFNTIVLPLFGRMAAGDQQRIFRAGTEAKIIVSTNVAETSVTIPGIRYVVDTGLARISRYNAVSRTQGLPVSPVSQASADQRKGRCGRVAEGVCIRLYSEENYLNRPLYTPPEILRSNLAEVILRMLYLRLGNIQEFPFLEPPSPAAVKDGFGVLTELGAVDDRRSLTPIGKTMARFPLDPRLSRMLIAAKEEGALRETVVLVAAMSVQDPRERPLDQETKADQAHAVFRDPRSDFSGLLKIWSSCWGHLFEGDAFVTGEGGVPLPMPASRGQSQIRKFCRERFLSYRRMREWKDIHDESWDILKEMGEFTPNDRPASYDALHRSILGGYLSHIALRKEKNVYTAAKNRQVMLFPGSGLFNRGGAWIMASEMVQTSRLFARVVAEIDPEWLEKIGRHLCRYSWSEPHWEKRRGEVVAFERATLYGLTVVADRKVGYGRVNMPEAREIFIRSALVEGDVLGNYGFLNHNRKLIHDIEDLENKARKRDLLVDEETLFAFYDRRLPAFADIRSLDRFIKEQGGDGILRMTEADVLRIEPDFTALEAFPDTLAVGETTLPLRYAFHPGEDDDGVTVRIPVHALASLSPEPFEWLVPGMIEEKVALLLKALPKGARRRLVPVRETAQRIVRLLPFREGDFHLQLGRAVREVAGVDIDPDWWDPGALAPYHFMRFEIVGHDGKVLGTGRDWAALKSLSSERHEDALRIEAKRRWEREGITAWDFGDLPRRIELGKDALGLVRYAWPSLAAEGETPAVRLFDDPIEAARSGREGLMLLYGLVFGSELKQLMKDWAFPEKFSSGVFFMGGIKKASEALRDYIRRELFGLRRPQFPERPIFEETVKRLKGSMGPPAREMMEEVFEAVEAREDARAALARFRKTAAGNPAVLRLAELLAGEIEKLVPPDFLSGIERDNIQRLPRYLRALKVRMERAYASPEKDRVKADQLAPQLLRLAEMTEKTARRPDEKGLRVLDEFRWMIEEYKISLFAPEIKTTCKVSPKRLEEKWREWASPDPPQRA